MRERAANHPHQTDGMRDAIAVFDDWLEEYQDPSMEEKRLQKKEWDVFKKLCESSANQHSYGRDPTVEELNRARTDVSDGQRLLTRLLIQRRPNEQPSQRILFPLTSFVALFGRPGLHGYGKHVIDSEQCTSTIQVDSIEGIEELIGSSNTSKLRLVDPIHFTVHYDRIKENATITFKQSGTRTLESLWGKAVAVTKQSSNSCSPKRKKREYRFETRSSDSEGVSWTCSMCTYVHDGTAKPDFLTCEVCGSQRAGSRKRVATSPSSSEAWESLCTSS